MVMVIREFKGCSHDDSTLTVSILAKNLIRDSWKDHKVSGFLLFSLLAGYLMWRAKTSPNRTYL